MLSLWPGQSFLVTARTVVGLALVAMAWGAFTARALAADYTVTTTNGNAIVVTNVAGNGDTLTISEPSAGNIQFAAAGRTFSVNGGAPISGNSGVLSRSNVTQITVNEAAGADTINVGAFTGTLPSLTVNGGKGNDTVNFSGNINFASGASLDVDLQNDDPTPGTDVVNVSGNLIASGTGTITVRCSKNVNVNGSGSLQTTNGNLVVEANQQAVVTTGNFNGITITGLIRCTGTGQVMVKGRAGNDPGGYQLGVYVISAGQIIGGPSGLLTVIGTGGASTNTVNRGVTVYNTNSLISSLGGPVQVTGQGGSAGSFYGIGVSLLYGGVISAGGSGSVTVTGIGAGGGAGNYGIEMSEPGTAITSAGGLVTVTGTAGAGGDPGITLANQSSIINTNAADSLTLISDSISMDNNVTIAGTGNLTIKPKSNGTLINLGGADAAGTLGLTDAELDRVRATTIVIGDTNAGAITISAPISPTNAAALRLVSGGVIRDTYTGGADVIVTNLTTSGNLSPGASPGNFSVTGNETLAPNSIFTVELGGITPGTQYDQLSTTGSVTISTNVVLNLLSFGGYIPSGGESFMIISRTGGSGTFAAAPQGSLFLNFLGSGLTASITYTGGTGDDVVIAVSPMLTVTNTADSGAGSLRQAILSANANPGPDIIRFNIPGPAPHVIQALTDFPVLSQPVRIDGTTQPGYAGKPLIELSGGIASTNTGLFIQTSNSVVAGLALTHFRYGLRISGSQSSSNWIYGNYIGLDTTGTNIATNTTCISVESGAHHNLIGTDGNGVNDTAERNVISGAQTGVNLAGANTNRFAGNFIGTDRTGTVPLGNQDGFFITSSAGNIIGTDSSNDPFNANERNVISGNGRALALSGPNRISGNFIGTDPTGAFAVPNTVGIQIGGVGTLVGSDGDGLYDNEERNVISGNSDTAVIAGGATAHDAVIRGNYIGTDASGTLALPNGYGINFNNHPSHMLITENVISGNINDGLISANGPFSNSITANFIGVDVSGTNALGNGGNGVYLLDASWANTIGGTLPGDGNVIAYNGGAGVVIQDASSVSNSILGNSIFANTGIGIDLNADGVTLNDLTDSDPGPNGLQNFPVISSVNISGSTVIIGGSLTSLPGANYWIEFFSSPVKDASGYGEGQHFIGSQSATTGTNGVASFLVVGAVPIEPTHWITATATDPFGNTSEFSLAVNAQPGNLPLITGSPTNITVSPGSNVTLCVTASGTQPIYYQWRENGVNILGATNSCLTLPAAQAQDGGAFDVVVSNPFGGAIVSSAATVIINVPVLSAGNNFANRVPLGASNGTVRASNVNATREVGEPLHAGQPGGASVWYSFTSAVAGVMNINTSGSSFDTLLAVYTGSTLPTLVEVVSDEDSGGSLTSALRFNVAAGVQYNIVVDGFGGATGNFVLSWSFQPSTNLYPVIVTQPTSITVAPGANHTFSVNATGSALTYQWFFNGSSIPGATTNTLSLSNIQAAALGTYLLRVTNGTRWTESHPVSLQINLTDGVTQPAQATDKFLDASLLANPIVLGTTGTSFSVRAPASIVVGYTGTQIFNTFGSVNAVGEPPVCGVTGGASTWLKLVAQQSGELHVNTDGSSFDTVVEVFERIIGVTNLHSLGCDNNSGLDHVDSALVVPVVAGRTNFIDIEGVNGATGVLTFNYNLVVPSTLTAMGRNGLGQFQFLVTGKPGMSFSIQSGSNPGSWTNLFSGSDPDGSYIFTDTSPPPQSGGRFYRLLMLP